MKNYISVERIHSVLIELINQKTQKDGKTFNGAKLAASLNLPRSSISRLIHPDANKRLTNPTLNTLIKIIDFFNNEGINITLNDFVSLKKRSIDVQEQQIQNLNTSIPVPLYDIYDEYQNTSIIADVENPFNQYKALVISNNFPPFFKKGSIFIIDQNKIPQNDNMIAIKIDNNPGIQIKKIFITQKNIKYISNLMEDNQKNALCKYKKYVIIGVVTGIITKF